MVPDPPVSDDITRTRFHVKFPYILSMCITFKRFAVTNADDMEIKRLPCSPERDRMWWINSSYTSYVLIKSNKIKSNHPFFPMFWKRGFWIHGKIMAYIIPNALISTLFGTDPKVSVERYSNLQFVTNEKWKLSLLIVRPCYEELVLCMVWSPLLFNSCTE